MSSPPKNKKSKGHDDTTPSSKGTIGRYDEEREIEDIQKLMKDQKTLAMEQKALYVQQMSVLSRIHEKKQETVARKQMRIEELRRSVEGFPENTPHMMNNSDNSKTTYLEAMDALQQEQEALEIQHEILKNKTADS